MKLTGSPPAPDWVKSGAALKRGLDLTGLRLPVQAIGYRLLDGVTTITPSIRYLSFYCWMLKSYAEARREDSWSEFCKLAEQVEAAIAYGNRLTDPQVTGVVGTDKASRLLASGEELLPLEALVQQLAVNAYANPSSQLGLTFDRGSAVPGITEERGLELARGLYKTVRKTSLGDRFSRAESIDRATLGELKEFGQAISVADVPEDEFLVLTRALVPESPRQSEIPRIATYAALLALAEEHHRLPEERDLFEKATTGQSTLDPILETCLDGWLRFATRDMVSASHEAVLKQVHSATQELAGEGRRPVLIDAVIRSLLRRDGDHAQALNDLGLSRSKDSLSEMSFPELRQRVEEATAKGRAQIRGLNRWSGDLVEQQVSRVALASGPGSLVVLPVAWLLAAMRTENWSTSSEEAFESRADIGWARFGVSEVIRPAVDRYLSEGWNLFEVMQELALRTVEQHLRMAWSRMGVDPTRNVAVLAWDADSWWPLDQNVSADHTASRLPQAIGWLRQLGLVAESGLTNRGEELLERALDVLRQAQQ